jgi:hypothetical protein
MVEPFAPNSTLQTESVGELQRVYREMEALVRDENFEPERMAALMDRSEELFGQLMEQAQSSVDPPGAFFREKLVDASEQLNRLIALLRMEKEEVFQQINSLKNSRSALSAYQRPQIGMGYTEGKFLDNKK